MAQGAQREPRGGARAKSDAKSDAKPDVKANAKADVKSAAKSDVKSGPLAVESGPRLPSEKPAAAKASAAEAEAEAEAAVVKGGSSKDFAICISISCAAALPRLTSYFLHN